MVQFIRLKVWPREETESDTAFSVRALRDDSLSLNMPQPRKLP